MPFTNYAVETFISKHVVELTSLGITDISKEFPNSGSWLARLGMLAVLTNQFASETRPFAIQFTRKIEMALAEYSRAKIEVEKLLTGAKQWSPYFRALHHIESSVSLVYQSYDLSRKKIGTPLFRPNDNSSIQRLNSIYNITKHEAAGPDEPIWISNTSICSTIAALTYIEYESMLRECSRIAERITTEQKGQ